MNYKPIIEARRELDAVLKAAEIITAALRALEETTGKYIDDVRVDTRNFGRLATEIFLTKKVTRLHSMTATIEIIGDGNTVWVNDSSGACIGRFGRGGVDVHVSGAEQMAGGRGCLDCFHGGTPPQQWARFCKSMLRFHGVTVPGRFKPEFVGEHTP